MSVSAAEQLLIEMINRARLDPLGEAARFGIDLNEGLAAGTLDGSVRQVLAPNAHLHKSSDAHGAWMLKTDTFSHTGAGGSSAGDRMKEAGYVFTGSSASGENLTYSGSTGPIDPDVLMKQNHHRDLFLSAGHRENMLRDFFSEIGVSQLVGEFTAGGRNLNTSMVVENFALSGTDVFLTGVSYIDSDSDNFYSIGEGRAGIRVQAASSSTQTLAAGGYAISLAPARDVTVTLGTVQLSVDLSQGNGKLDLEGANHVLTSVDATLTSAAGSLTALGVGDINLTGHGGDDVLVGNKGNNVLSGGGGVDTVRYDLNRAQATINAREDGTVTVVSQMGRDTLIDIELIAFNDQTLTTRTLFAADPPPPAPQEEAIDNWGATLRAGPGADALYTETFAANWAPEISAQVFRLYQAALDRAPDTNGHSAWTKILFEQEQSLAQVARGFVASAEFQQTYGALDTGSFVDLLYENVLGRSADPGGYAGWVKRIDDGDLSREQAVTGFSESREFINKTAGAAASFTRERTVSEWSDDVFRLYAATLDRAPDTGGFEVWTKALAGGMNFTDAVAKFVGSAEFGATYGDLSADAFVDLLYRNVFDRNPDPDGRQHWLDALETGQSRAEVVKAFVQSAEFRATTARPLEEWIKAQGIHDVIVGGAGNNVLAGGLWSDAFVFNAAQSGTNRVLDLEAWDVLRFDGFGYTNTTQVLSHFEQQGRHLVFDDQDVRVIFQNTDLAQISDDMVLI